MTRGLSHTITGTTLPVTDTQSPSVSPAWPRRHRPVSRPHVPGAGPPHAPCHPQSRADTVQTPPSVRPALQPHRGAAVPSRTPTLVAAQVSRARGVSGARRLLKLQVPPMLAHRAQPGLESRPEGTQVPEQGAQRHAGARGAEDAGTGRGGGAGRGVGAAASAAPTNFLGDAGSRGAPLGSASLRPRPQVGGLGSARPPYLAAPQQLQ